MTGYVVNSAENLQIEKNSVAMRTTSTLGVDINEITTIAIIRNINKFLKNPRTQKINEFLRISLIGSSKVTAIV